MTHLQQAEMLKTRGSKYIDIATSFGINIADQLFKHSDGLYEESNQQSNITAIVNDNSFKKVNPNHDELGRFSENPSPKQLFAREKEKYAKKRALRFSNGEELVASIKFDKGISKDIKSEISKIVQQNWRALSMASTPIKSVKIKKMNGNDLAEYNYKTAVLTISEDFVKHRKEIDKIVKKENKENYTFARDSMEIIVHEMGHAIHEGCEIPEISDTSGMPEYVVNAAEYGEVTTHEAFAESFILINRNENNLPPHAIKVKNAIEKATKEFEKLRK